MKIYRLYRKQILPIALTEAWDYFSTPVNLDDLTPPDMKFKILDGADQKTYAGQLIRYKITPFSGISMDWVTEITQCVEAKYFIDEQRFGPYKLWHHQHHFHKNGKGVIMEDILHYALPLGWLGNLVAGHFVSNKVEGIFDYRYEMLAQRFGA